MAPDVQNGLCTGYNNALLKTVLTVSHVKNQT